MRLLKLQNFIKWLSHYGRYVFSQLKDIKHIGTIMGEKGHPNLFDKEVFTLKILGHYLKITTLNFHLM